MKRYLPLLPLLFAGLDAAPVHAEVVRDLYQTQIPVTEQGGGTRQQVLDEAFRDVLVKVSGYSGVIQDPAVSEALKNVDRYVQQFQYRPAATGPGSVFWVKFDRSGVQQLLQANDMPVWGSERPVTLIWLAVEERGERRLVGTTEQSVYAGTLKQEAEKRGVPIRLPLLDLTDQTGLAASDVWGGFRSTILKASERYQAQAVLVGRLYTDPAGEWHGRWELYQGADTVRWEDRGERPEQVLASGLNSTTDTVALHYTRTYGEGGEPVINLQVQDIGGVSDYDRVAKYLSGISGVADVQVTEVGPDSATFQLKLDGSRDGVIQSIGLGDILEAKSSADTAATADTTASVGTTASEDSTAPLVGSPSMHAAPEPPEKPDLVYRLLK